MQGNSGQEPQGEGAGSCRGEQASMPESRGSKTLSEVIQEVKKMTKVNEKRCVSPQRFLERADVREGLSRLHQ